MISSHGALLITEFWTHKQGLPKSCSTDLDLFYQIELAISEIRQAARTDKPAKLLVARPEESVRTGTSMR